MIAPSRRRRSCRSRATARIAITSDAAVMSKPGLARVAVRRRRRARATISRSARSFMSSTRRQPIRSTSMSSGLPCRIDASSIAASRLLAAPTAWMSPVKWRLRSSIGTTWREPAAGRSALDPEHRAERGLAQAQRPATCRPRRDPASARSRSSSCPPPPSSASCRRRTRSCRRAHRRGARSPTARSSPCGDHRARTPRLESAALGDLLDRQQLGFLSDLQAAVHRASPPVETERRADRAPLGLRCADNTRRPPRTRPRATSSIATSCNGAASGAAGGQRSSRAYSGRVRGGPRDPSSA